MLKKIAKRNKTVRNISKIVYNHKFQTFFTGDQLLFFSLLFFKYFNFIAFNSFSFKLKGKTLPYNFYTFKERQGNYIFHGKNNAVNEANFGLNSLKLKFPKIKNKLGLYRSLNFPTQKFLDHMQALCKASISNVQSREQKGVSALYNFNNTPINSTFPLNLLSHTFGPQTGEKLINRMSKTVSTKTFGIIRIHTGFTNLNISLTALDGKILQWISGGSDPTQSKRTRMSSRAVGNLMLRFLKNFKKKLGIRFIKVLFTGPSKRFRSKFFSMIKRRSRRFKISIICKEEGFQRSFNGCRLSRKKR